MKWILLTATCVLGFATSASAATYTFGADAEAFDTNLNKIEGTFDQVYNDTDSSQFGRNIDGGIKVAASASNPAAPGNVVVTPFLDSKSGGKIAGLGVCSTGFDAGITNAYGGESQCSTHYTSNGGTGTHEPGDDNLVFEEVLK